jgi:hypothetical protein
MPLWSDVPISAPRKHCITTFSARMSSASVAALVSKHVFPSPELQVNRHSTEFYNSDAFGQSITTWTDGSPPPRAGWERGPLWVSELD